MKRASFSSIYQIKSIKFAWFQIFFCSLGFFPFECLDQRFGRGTWVSSTYNCFETSPLLSSVRNKPGTSYNTKKKKITTTCIAKISCKHKMSLLKKSTSQHTEEHFLLHKHEKTKIFSKLYTSLSAKSE